jgi:hypothetical protein
MPKMHEQPARTPDVRLHLNDDGTWSHGTVTNALLFDIRGAIEAQTAVLREANACARAHLTVSRRIDRRLAKRVKLR